MRKLFLAFAAALAAGWTAPISTQADDFEDRLSAGLQEIRLSAQSEPAQTLALPPAKVDLSSQLELEPRDQGDLLTCHAFATVALMESAYFRAYGERIRLSEADLFIGADVAKRSIFRGRETGTLTRDLRFALDNGVLEGSDYADFSTRWKAWRSRKSRFRDSREKIMAELLPSGVGPKAEASRQRVRQALSAARAGSLRKTSFFGSAARTFLSNGKVSCSQLERRRDLIMSHLAAGQPVAIGFFPGAVSDPDIVAHNKGFFVGAHYIVLTGYERTPEGTLFRIRNSWGRRPGAFASLTEGDLCSVFSANWLSLPGELGHD